MEKVKIQAVGRSLRGNAVGVPFEVSARDAKLFVRMGRAEMVDVDAVEVLSPSRSVTALRQERQARIVGDSSAPAKVAARKVTRKAPAKKTAKKATKKAAKKAAAKKSARTYRTRALKAE